MVQCWSPFLDDEFYLYLHFFCEVLLKSCDCVSLILALCKQHSELKYGKISLLGDSYMYLRHLCIFSPNSISGRDMCIYT